MGSQESTESGGLREGGAEAFIVASVKDEMRPKLAGSGPIPHARCQPWDPSPGFHLRVQ